MDSFKVTAKSIDLLEHSELVSSMQDDTPDASFSLIWNGYEYPFESIDGGYVEDEAYHLVKLSTYDDIEAPHDFSDGQYEVHLASCVWNLEVKEYYEYMNEHEYTLALKVTGFTEYEHSFSEAMRETVDGRWSEHDVN